MREVKAIDREGQVLEHSTGLYTFLVLSSDGHWDRVWHRCLVIESKLEVLREGQVIVRHEGWRDTWEESFNRLA